MLYSTYKFSDSASRVYESNPVLSKDGAEQLHGMEMSATQRVKMSGAQLYRVEHYISTGGRREPHVIPQADDLLRLIEVFHLEKQRGVFIGDPDEIYTRLRGMYPDFDWDRFPNHDGKGFKRLSYAVTYGDAPVTIIQPAK